MHDTDLALDDLPLDLHQKIDELCVRFERDWCARNTPSLDAYLAEVPESGRVFLLAELLGLELEYRRLRGDTFTFEEYAARFPEYGDLILDVLATARGEVTRRVANNRPLRAPLPVDPAGSGPRHFGDYVLIRKVGQGGMGVVYEARQESLNRTVALKMIRAGEFADAEERSRFQNEVQTLSRLDHPGIVPIIEVGAVGDQRYYTMKLIAGGNLSEQLGRYTGDFNATARLLIALAEAVHHAHQRGVLHRDLKPANILVDAEGRPHVTDFGLAKWSGMDATITATGAIVGSPAYMAPEQAAGDRAAVTTATDVYGLGAILYALLAGRPPFQGESVLETLDQVRDRIPDSPSKTNPRVPRDLELICRTCLEKDPKRRYPSAIAVAEDLERWLAGKPIAARRVGVATRGWMWCKRRPALAALMAALVVALGGGFFGITTEWRRAETNLRLAGQANAGLKTANAGLKRAQIVLRRTLYAAQLSLAQNAWESNNIARVRDLLELARPGEGEFDSRGFEWYYWDRLSQTEIRTFRGLETDLAPVAFSPDGTRLAAADKRGYIKVWECESGREVLSFQGHSTPIRALAYSPSGHQFVTAGMDRRARVWDANTGDLVCVVSGHDGPVNCVAYRPDGQRVVSTSWDKTAKVWDPANGTVLRTLPGHTDRVRCAAFSRDGKRIATGSFDQSIRIWDAETGTHLLTLIGHTDVVGALAFSPDGHWLASASNDGTIRLWDAGTGAPGLTLKGHTSTVHALAYSPDGSRIASASWDRTVKLWDAASGDELLSFKGHTDHVMSVAYSPDGKRIASCSSDNTVKLWEPLGCKETLVLRGHVEKIRDVAFSPDSSRLASVADDGSVYLWDVNNGQRAAVPRKERSAIFSVSFSPDGQFATDFEGTVQIRDGSTGQVASKLGTESVSACRAVFRPDGQQIAASSGKTINIWDTRAGKVIASLEGHTEPIASLSYGPDGTRLVSADESGHVKVWDAERHDELFTLGDPQPNYEDNAVVYSPDGRRIVSAGSDGMARVWDAENGQELLTLKGHIGAIFDVAFSPDGRRIVTGGRDQTVKVWDAVSGNEVLTLKGHTSAVVAVAFSSDGRRIASGGGDRTVRIWDAGPNAPREVDGVDPLESP